MYHGDAGPARDSRKLASMHESTPGSIVPSCASSEGNVVTGGHQRNCYPAISYRLERPLSDGIVWANFNQYELRVGNRTVSFDMNHRYYEFPRGTSGRE